MVNLPPRIVQIFRRGGGGALPNPVFILSAGHNVQAGTRADLEHRSGELQVPDRYIRTEEVPSLPDARFDPVVDLGRLIDPRSSEEELANLVAAFHRWGYFQVREGVDDQDQHQKSFCGREWDC